MLKNGGAHEHLSSLADGLLLDVLCKLAAGRAYGMCGFGGWGFV